MQTVTRSEFPIKGVVGVLGGGPDAVGAALRRLEEASRPEVDAIEVRADLFPDPRQALVALKALPPGLPRLFTVRLAAQGGKFTGEEAARLELFNEALACGADLLDAEWASAAARALAQRRAPLLVSHHDFASMPSPEALDSLTRDMLALAPRAIKLVPTAQRPVDALRMLEWVAGARAGEPRRLGFAMGEMGLPSRILSLAWGAPFTYGAWGEAVAPGQPPAAELKGLYRAERLSRATRVFGVAGSPVAHSLSPHLHNPAFQARGIDAVYLPFRLEALADMQALLDPLQVDGLSVTVPFKEEALRLADRAEGKAQAAGAANTLLIRREPPAGRLLLAFNTDFEGVLGPLWRRRIDLKELPVAILGNGGAARGAAQALKEAGARVTLYARSFERGQAVAKALGVAVAALAELPASRHRLIINATPLGLKAGDPSPAPPAAFRQGVIAFDMVYGPRETEFIGTALAQGAETIPGSEMLICQGLVQFHLFTGMEASYEEFALSFQDGQAARGRH